MARFHPGKWLSSSSTLLLLIAGLAATGCGGRGDVSGQVKFEGTPISSGRITFQVQEGNKEAFSSAITNGSYEIKDVPTGEVKVMVESFKPREADMSMVPKDLGIMRDKGTPPATDPAKYVEIPLRYGKFEESGLSYTVTKGPQTQDFNLTVEKKE